MSTLTNYTELNTAITDYLARSDLTSYYANWIALFEARANAKLRVRRMETTATLVPVSGVATLPTDYLSFRRVTWAGDPSRALEYVMPEWLTYNYPTSAAGTPSVFSIEGNNLTVRPSSDSNITLYYFQRIPSLETNSTNWLMTNWPNAYLFGALAEGYKFQKDDVNTASWLAHSQDVLDDIQRVSDQSRATGGIRIVGPTP